MRDKSRIKPFMNELAEIWEKNCPDWRFGQLLVNVIDNDPFYMEEKEMLDKFKQFFNKKGE